jgi:hypothetical protein
MQLMIVVAGCDRVLLIEWSESIFVMQVLYVHILDHEVKGKYAKIVRQLRDAECSVGLMKCASQ